MQNRKGTANIPKRKQKSAFSSSKQHNARQHQQSWMILLCCLACVLASGFSIAGPSRYLPVGGVVRRDIYASEDIVDDEATLRARQHAAEAVEPVYAPDAEAYRMTELRCERFLSAMDTLRGDADNLRRQIIQASDRDSDLRNYQDGTLTAAEWAKVLGDSGHQQLARSYGDWLENDQIDRLLALPQSSYNSWLRDITIHLNAQLRKGIPDGQREELRALFITDLQKSTPFTAQSIIPIVAEYCLQSTMFLDEEATQHAIEAAMNRTPDVIISQGEVLIAAGDTINSKEHELLLESGTALTHSDIMNRWLSVAGFYVILYFLISGYLSQWKSRLFLEQGDSMILLLLVVIDLLLAYFFIPLHTCYNTAILGVLLVTQLVSPGSGLLMAVLISPAIGFISGGIDVNYMYILRAILATLVGSSAGVYVMQRSTRRSSVLQGALCNGLGIMAVYAVFTALSGAHWQTFLWEISCVLVISLICGVLDIGLLPLWEICFDVATPVRLMELSDINHPLLQRLMIEAPGTYNHSVMVGTLAEAAATAIGINATLTRVGAYFHDIGKLQRPQYFVENQRGLNPHDMLDPHTSAAIIIAHVADGVSLAKTHRLPRTVRNMIPQHHGDSMVAAFYYKAVEQSGDKDLPQEDYRYPGPRPQSKEAAVLMIADSVEAAVRSLPEQTPVTVSDRIDKVIGSKISDRQLSQCNLSMAELEKIRLTMLHVYDGLLHERIEYPDIDALRTELAEQGHISLEASTENPAETTAPTTEATKSRE